MIDASSLKPSPPTALPASPAWEMIVAELPDGWRDLARPHKIMTMRRAPTGAKLTSVDQVLRLILSYVGLDSSLRTTVSSGAAGQEVPAISPGSLHDWVKKSGGWLGDILTQMTSSDLLFAPEQWKGFEVVVGDATVVTRPGTKGTDARVHYLVKLSDFTYTHCEVTDEHGGEKLSRLGLQPGQLGVLDRAYCNPPALVYTKKQQADLLVRYNRGSLPLYDERGQSFDVQLAVDSLSQPGDIAEWDVWVQPKGTRPIPVRLLARKLTPSQTQEAMKRLRTEYGKEGKSVPPEAESLAGYIVLVCTVQKDLLSSADLFRLYRLRWQVERIIKQDKSIGGLGKLPNFLPATIQCWLNAKMLLAMVARRLVQRAAEPAFPP